MGIKIKSLVSSLPRHSIKKYKTRALSDIKRLVIHCTPPFVESPEQIANYDVSPSTVWPDGVVRENQLSKTGAPACTYTYLVKELDIWQTLELTEIGWHVGVWNPGSVGIGLLYDPSNADGLDDGSIKPPDATYNSAVRLCGALSLKLGLSPSVTVGHRELKGTGWFVSKGKRRLRKSCPGLGLDLDDFRLKITRNMQWTLALLKMYRGEVDGVWGTDSQMAAHRFRLEGYQKRGLVNDW